MGEIFMPKMGDAMTEGKVVRWYKQPGDAVKKGEPVLEIETDKVNLDLESEEDGVLDEIQVQEGQMAPVGATLATTKSNGAGAAKRPASGGEDGKKKPRPENVEEEAAPQAKQQDSRPKPPAQPPQQQQPPAQQQRTHLRAVETPPPSSGAKGVRSSPLARKMAREMGVDLGSIQGSGPNGRIVAADIQGAGKGGGKPQIKEAPTQRRQPSETPAAPLEEKTIPLSAMRRTIAKRLVESIGPIPHFYLTIDADVTNLLALRTQLNEIEQVKSSVNDFMVRAAALALRQHPNVNASFAGDAIQQHGEIHIGIAVATPEGLITPVIRNADTKSIPEIAAAVRDLAERAKNRRLRPDEYQGSTLTISNLGMFGIDEFTAIINPPNSAILAVGVAGPHPVAIERQVVVRDRMKITMSCDHRVIDGAAGAQYLQTLRQFLEQPIRVIL
jgi:pyruvate dehydrogenase E2 component (dihydrolipoamide acetyltransferase)